MRRQVSTALPVAIRLVSIIRCCNVSTRQCIILFAIAQARAICQSLHGQVEGLLEALLLLFVLRATSIPSSTIVAFIVYLTSRASTIASIISTTRLASASRLAIWAVACLMAILPTYMANDVC